MKTIAKQLPDAIQGTKKYIIDTARHLFSEFSYLGVSMNDIAKKLKITKAALYYHFTGKKEIYKKVLDDVFNDLSFLIKEALNETIIEKRLQRLIKNYLDFGLKEKNLIKALILKLSRTNHQVKEHIIQLRKQIVDLIQPVVEEMFSNKKLAQKINGRLLTSLLISMMDSLLLEYSFLNKKIDSKKVSNQIITVVFN